ncbi:unnamed protein product [Trichobilharzia regenti]|nr:unnamed protein product [Trichobilharzia regenti]
MRKKTESQPPFLPDLTNEALGMASQNTVSRSAASPGSSSGGSFEANSQINISSSSPLIRLLKSNGPDIDLVSWADDPSIRSALGIRGSIVADVAHILLEYAHQVFGVQFKSLFQLAQHLVTNRYVNSRSKHAFALIAHAANPPVSFSPPPSTALAEVLQKGAVKSAFDKIRNGRQNSAASDSSYRSECIKLEANALSQSSVSDNRSANLSTSIPNRGMNNHGMPTLTSSTPYSTVQMSHCSTAQRVVDNKPYESNTAALSQNSCVSSYTASVLASPSALQSSNQHLSNYPFTLTQVNTTSFILIIFASIINQCMHTVHFF